jgi:hypothetical protein
MACIWEPHNLNVSTLDTVTPAPANVGLNPVIKAKEYIFMPDVIFTTSGNMALCRGGGMNRNQRREYIFKI